MKKVLCLLLAAVLIFALAACGNSENTEFTDKTAKATPANTVAPKDENPSSGQENKVLVEITMEDDSVMALELYPDIAPITVENFTKLAKDGFYDGLTFHRIIEGFMIQGGDPEGTGRGGSDKTIKGEFAENGVENKISHKRGVISMARSSNPDSASSQFFICHADSEYLDGQYAAFGVLTDGFEVLDKIAENAKVTDSNGTVLPEDQPVIKTVKVVE